MSITTHSNLVMATRSVQNDNIINSSGLSTAKQYFASKREIPPAAAPVDAVWDLRAYGTVKSALALAPTIMVNLEIDRAVIISIPTPFAPGLNLANLKWQMQAMLTRGDGTLMVNGSVAMQTALTGALISYPLVTNGVYTVDWSTMHTVEISMSYSAIGTGNTITLEQMVVREDRFQ